MEKISKKYVTNKKLEKLIQKKEEVCWQTGN